MIRIDSSRAVRIGAIGVISTVTVVLASLSYDKLPLINNEPTYSAYFTEAAGLVAGAQVNVAGVRVGTVNTVDVEDNARVKVDFTLAGNIALGGATSAAVKTQTVLGTKRLEIEPSGSGRMHPGDAIPVDRTRTPYDLTDAVGDLTTTISDIDTKQVTDAMGTLSQTLTQIAPNLTPALDGISSLSDTIASRDEALTGLLKKANSVTSVLADRDHQISTLLLDGNTLLGQLDARRQAIDVLLTNVHAVSRQVSAMVADNEEQMRPTLEKLNSVTEILDTHKQDIQKAILPLSQYATSLGESVGSGPFFKAYVANLLPGQFIQPFIDAAFGPGGPAAPNPAGGPR